MSKKCNITYKVLGSSQKTLRYKIKEAEKKEDYEKCARLQQELQSEKIKDLLRQCKR